MNKTAIIKAYLKIREIDNTIPDDVLDFMKDAAIEKLSNFMEEKIEQLIQSIGKEITGKEALEQLTELHNVDSGKEFEVTVLDLGNYKTSFAETTPFKAILYDITGYPCFWVRSIVTGKEYELYGNQIEETGGKAENF